MLINKWIEDLNNILMDMWGDAWTDMDLRADRLFNLHVRLLEFIFNVLVWVRAQKSQYECIRIALRKAYRHTWRSGRYSIVLFVQYFKLFRRSI
jgi:hypothetical protein